jgi:hypothetical protein
MAYDDEAKRRAYQRDYYRRKIQPKRREERRDKKERTVGDRKVLVSLRIRGSIAGRIAGLFHQGVAKEAHSHRTPSDFYADLLIRGLETLKGDEDVAEALQYLKASGAIDAIGQHRREAQAAFARVKIEMVELQQIGADEAGMHYYWATMQSFEEMSPNVWRDWFLEQMVKSFPKLANRRPKGVSLDVDRPRGGKRQKSR